MSINRKSAGRTSLEKKFLSQSIGSLLFFLVVLIQIGIYCYLIIGQRIVAGHDGFAIFTGKYVYLNNMANCGEIVEWLPFLMHGTLSTFGYIYAGGILQNIFLLNASFLKGVNFIPLFYAEMFVYELVLLVGVWLLARRFLTSPFSLFFVTLSIMGSSIWFLQPHYNFYLYFAIPLILYFIHEFVDSGKWRHFFLAGNLLFIQCFGNNLAFLPVISLTIFLYVFFFVGCDKASWLKIKKIRLDRYFVLSTLFIMFLFVALFAFMHFGSVQIASYGLRGADGSVPINQFLTYGGEFSWRIWLELFTGISPCTDYTLYAGVFCVPFVVLGVLLNVNKRNIHFLLLGVFLLLFSAGTFVSKFAYFCWPMMKYYRHILLISPMIKVIICFLAGFGIDAVFFDKARIKSPVVLKTIFFVIAVCMFILAVLLHHCSVNHEAIVNFLRIMAPRFLPVFLPLFNENLFSSLLTRTVFFVLASAIFFIALTFFHHKLQTKRAYFLFLIAVLLAFHGADMYSFRFVETKLKTFSLNDECYNFFEFQPLPYSKRRDSSFWNDNPRSELLKKMPVIVDSGSFYAGVNTFVFKDQLGNSFRTDFWMLPLDKYMKAYWGQPIDDRSIPPRGLFYRSGNEYPRLEFPTSHPAVLKISGVIEDKIQFFSRAEIIASERAIAAKITDPVYKGDCIFLSPLESKMKSQGESFPNISVGDVSADCRLHLPYQIRRFDANNIVITTELNTSEPVWMLYSDVWHPYWKATINDKQTPVYNANLAYKAVKLGKGFNEVHFSFNSGLLTWSHYFVGANSMFWVVLILFFTCKIVLYGKRDWAQCNSNQPQKIA